MGLVGLGGEPGQEDLGLGFEDALEHFVLDEGTVGEHEAALDDLLEGVGVGDLLVEPEEEVGELPPDDGGDQLVAPPGKYRYTVARDTPASWAASSTVVLAKPQRATQS